MKEVNKIMEDKLKRLKESMDESVFKENPVSHKNKERIFERIEKGEMNDGVKNIFAKWMSRGAMAIVGVFLVFFLWDTVGKEIINSPGNQQQGAPAVDQKENDSNVEQDDELNPKQLRFRGESDNWKVQYLATVKPKGSKSGTPVGSETDYLTLKYIGDDQPPTKIDYKIDGSLSENSGTDVLIQNRYGGSDLGGCENCAIVTENHVMDITIDWAGESENIKLKIKEFDKKLNEWISESYKILSEPLDDPRLKEANNDEGFEYYLKSESIRKKLSEDVDFVPIEKDRQNIFSLTAYIAHLQFVRTSSLGHNGEAMEATELVDEWEPIDEDMKQAYEYLDQLIHDLDITLNQNGEGETYGVTYFLNGDKVSEMEKFLRGN